MFHYPKIIRGKESILCYKELVKCFSMLQYNILSIECHIYWQHAVWRIVRESLISILREKNRGSHFGKNRAALILTQWDLFPRVGRQQEDQQGQGGDEHTGEEKVEAVVEGPPAHHYGEGHVRVGLLAALVETLVPLSGNLCHTQCWEKLSHFSILQFRYTLLQLKERQ